MGKMSEKTSKNKQLNTDDKRLRDNLKNQLKKKLSVNENVPKYICECKKPLSFNVGLFADKNRLYIKNIRQCKNIYICMECRIKRLSNEQKKIKTIISFMKSMNHGVYFNTYIISNDKNKSLSDLLGVSRKGSGLLGALSILKNSSEYGYDLTKPSKKKIKKRAINSIKTEYKIMGGFRFLEITYNIYGGFSPHVHEIIFTENVLDNTQIEMLENELTRVYISSLKNVGLKYPKNRKPVIVKAADEGISGYITKTSNLSMNIEQKSDYTIENIFSMLLDDYKGYIPDSINPHDIFDEYYIATKNKRFMIWESNELKRQLDEVLFNNNSEGEFIGSVTTSEYMYIKDNYPEKLNNANEMIPVLNEIINKENPFTESIDDLHRGFKQPLGYYEPPKFEIDFEAINNQEHVSAFEDLQGYEYKENMTTFDYLSLYATLDEYGNKINYDYDESNKINTSISAFARLYPAIINKVKENSQIKTHHKYFMDNQSQSLKHITYHITNNPFQMLEFDSGLINQVLNLKTSEAILKTLILIDFTVFLRTALRDWDYDEIGTLTVNSITVNISTANLEETYNNLNDTFYHPVELKIEA